MVNDQQESADRNKLTDFEKSQLWFEIYRNNPCYAVMKHIFEIYCDGDAPTRLFILDQIRMFLMYDWDFYTENIEYVLRHDYFRHPVHGEEIWKYLADAWHEPLLLKRMLKNSSEVPYALKKVLYENLIAFPHWHNDIFQSLSASALETGGKIDKRDAQKLLAKLELPEHQERVEKLLSKLNS
jgi:hypothetical protein